MSEFLQRSIKKPMIVPIGTNTIQANAKDLDAETNHAGRDALFRKTYQARATPINPTIAPRIKSISA